jgi:hypothetical protein
MICKKPLWNRASFGVEFSQLAGEKVHEGIGLQRKLVNALAARDTSKIGQGR